MSNVFQKPCFLKAAGAISQALASQGKVLVPKDGSRWVPSLAAQMVASNVPSGESDTVDVKAVHGAHKTTNEYLDNNTSESVDEMIEVIYDQLKRVVHESREIILPIVESVAEEIMKGPGVDNASDLTTQWVCPISEDELMAFYEEYKNVSRSVVFAGIDGLVLTDPEKQKALIRSSRAFSQETMNKLIKAYNGETQVLIKTFLESGRDIVEDKGFYESLTQRALLLSAIEGMLRDGGFERYEEDLTRARIWVLGRLNWSIEKALNSRKREQVAIGTSPDGKIVVDGTVASEAFRRDAISIESLIAYTRRGSDIATVKDIASQRLSLENEWEKSVKEKNLQYDADSFFRARRIIRKAVLGGVEGLPTSAAIIHRYGENNIVDLDNLLNALDIKDFRTTEATVSTVIFFITKYLAGHENHRVFLESYLHHHKASMESPRQCALMATIDLCAHLLVSDIGYVSVEPYKLNYDSDASDNEGSEETQVADQTISQEQ